MNTEIHAAKSECITLVTIMTIAPAEWGDKWAALHEGLFLDPRHKQIYRAIGDLYTQSVTPEAPTVLARLQVADRESIVTEKYMMEMFNEPVVLSSLQYHIDVLIDCYKRREGERVLLESLAAVRDRKAQRDVNEVLDGVVTGVININSANGQNQIVGMEQGMRNLVNDLQRRAMGDFDTGLQTGLLELDKLIGSFEPGDLVIIGGRPSMGKTTLLQVIALNAARSKNKPCLVMSLEMSADGIHKRFLSHVARVRFSSLRSGQLDQVDWEKLTLALPKMQDLPIDINDQSEARLSDIRETARKSQNAHGQLGAIFVDYLQLVKSDSRHDKATENERVGEISKGLKAIAKAFKCPVIALSQLNRESEKRRDKTYKNSDLRASGQIEQDADVIIFVHRDDLYQADRAKHNGLADLFVTKQRNGECGVAVVRSDLAYCGFINNDNWSDAA